MNLFGTKREKRRPLVFVTALFLLITALVGTSRYLYRHERVLSVTSYDFAPGYGHKYVEYFNKIRVLLPIEPFNIMDFFTAEFLFIAGLICGFVFFALSLIPFKTDYKKLYLVFALGFIYLGMDELFTIHEFFGLNLANLFYPDLTGLAILSKDFNGTIIMAYAVIAIIIFFLNRRFFRGSRVALGALLIGLLFHGGSAVLDFLHEKLSLFISIKTLLGPFNFLLNYDEFYEMTAAFFYLIAFILYAIHTISLYYDNKNGSYILKKGI